MNGNVYFEDKVYTLEKPEIPSEYLGGALNDAVVLINQEEEYERKYLIFLLVFRQTLNTFFPYNEFRIVDEPLTISPLI